MASLFSPSGHLPGRSGRWSIWNLAIKNAFQQSDGFSRDLFLRAFAEWDPEAARRIRKLHVPAYGLNDVPDVFHNALQRYLL